MLRWSDWRNTTEGSARGTSNHPQKEGPRQRFLIWGCWLHKLCKWISCFVPGSLSAQEGPWEVQYSENMVEETLIEILETLKECLWPRWGSAQLEEPRWRTPRIHAEVECYAQMKAACDHFSSYQGPQQQSSEEALRVAREAHHWALATVAMLKGHIKWLDHSISCRQHRNHGCSSSHQHSGKQMVLKKQMPLQEQKAWKLQRADGFTSSLPRGPRQETDCFAKPGQT